MIYRQGPIRLIDCESTDPTIERELFVVEGDSAAQSVANLRNPLTQAVLPLQGKPLNAARAKRDKVLAHAFLAALIESLGTGIDADCDVTAVRYQRVLLLMDPDADGIHCGALLLLFFHRWMRPLLEAGRVETVRAPLAEIQRGDTPEPVLAYTETHFQTLCRALRERGESDFVTVRYRGLGSVSQTVLAATCLSPATRKSQVMTVGDA